MADMGLDTAFGAQGSADAIQQIFERRIALANAQRQQQTVDQNDALTRLKLQEHADEIRQKLEAGKQAEKDRADAAKAAEQDRQEKIAASTFTMNPVGADLGPKVGAQAQSLGFPVSRIQGAQVQQTAGFMPLPSAPAEGPGMQTVQGLTPINGPQAPAGVSATTADPQSTMNAPDTFKRGATQADVVKEREDKQKADQSDWQNSIRQELATLKEGQGDKQSSSYQLQPEIDPTTGKQTGRFLGYNTKANRWEPVQGQGPGATKAAPGAGQAAQQTKIEHDALDSLGQLDKSIDAVKDLVGPAAGRGETIEQWIGSADPKIQAFGTKLLLTKFRVDHAATGTARAGASPAIIAKWDNLLSQKVSYDGLKSAVQAAREILQGDNASGSVPAIGGTFQGGKVLKVEKVE